MTDYRDAVFHGAMERLAPILMTALAAGLALIPLALSGEKPGNERQTPMAIVILCGLLTSMVLNMLVVPALYLRFGRPVPMPHVPSPSGSVVLDHTGADSLPCEANLRWCRAAMVTLPREHGDTEAHRGLCPRATHGNARQAGEPGSQRVLSCCCWPAPRS